MRIEVASIHRIARVFLPLVWSIESHSFYLISTLAITSFYVTSCATFSHHEFSGPIAGWQTKPGQLMYRSPNTTLIGDVLVRFSKTGDFELIVSTGPGV